MTITKKQNESVLEIALEGRLDTITAPKLEKVLTESLEGVTELIFDLEKLEYISSAGLRVLLMAKKIMYRQGSMKAVHVGDIVREVFDVTGFSEILTIE